MIAAVGGQRPDKPGAQFTLLAGVAVFSSSISRS
jgi:hypothetical protein